MLNPWTVDKHDTDCIDFLKVVCSPAVDEHVHHIIHNLCTALQVIIDGDDSWEAQINCMVPILFTFLTPVPFFKWYAPGLGKL